MKLLIAGDFCPQNRVSKLFEQGKYGDVLDKVKGIIKSSDYSIVNFECPVRLGNETPNLNRISLYCRPSGLKAVSYAGFDCVTLANNHFRDWGDAGVKNTLRCCKEEKIDYVGGGDNLEEARKPFYKTISGERLAIINCCEHEFSLATESRGGSNPLNPVKQYYAITEARKNADYVVVIVHGGHEHYQLPSPRMQDTYRFFIDAGADTVINHHQHCISGYEIYHKKPIFYGIGNFCFDMNLWNTSMWYVGYMVALQLRKDNICFDLYPYTQCKDTPSVVPFPFVEIEHEIETLNEIIGDHDKMQDATRKYFDNCMPSVGGLIEPYTNRYIKALHRRGFFPSVVTKKWLMYLCNYTMCESHRDKMDYYFEHHIY